MQRTASLDIRKQLGKTQRLVNTINRLVQGDELPDRLIVTKEQLDYLLKSNRIEVLLGYKNHPEEYLFYTPDNVMEVFVKRWWEWWIK